MQVYCTEVHEAAFVSVFPAFRASGELAHLARAIALQAIGNRFKSGILHLLEKKRYLTGTGKETQSKRRKGARRKPYDAARGKEQYGQAKQRSGADAQGGRCEEGRGKLRKAGGRGTHPLIPGFPNGVTRTPLGVHRAHE